MHTLRLEAIALKLEAISVQTTTAVPVQVLQSFGTSCEGFAPDVEARQSAPTLLNLERYARRGGQEHSFHLRTRWKQRRIDL